MRSRKDNTLRAEQITWRSCLMLNSFDKFPNIDICPFCVKPRHKKSAATFFFFFFRILQFPNVQKISLLCIFFLTCSHQIHWLTYICAPTVSLAKVDSGTVTKCNFAGDKEAGASWTDKIMANKADAGSAEARGEGEGAAEDEWVRIYFQLITEWVAVQRNLQHNLFTRGSLDHKLLRCAVSTPCNDVILLQLFCIFHQVHPRSFKFLTFGEYRSQEFSF